MGNHQDGGELPHKMKWALEYFSTACALWEKDMTMQGDESTVQGRKSWPLWRTKEVDEKMDSFTSFKRRSLRERKVLLDNMGLWPMFEYDEEVGWYFYRVLVELKKLGKVVV